MRLQKLVPNAEAHFKGLRGLYHEMAEGYQKAAAGYRFSCVNCSDNCCQTRFYNHTYIEYFFLMEGIAGLDDDRQDLLKAKAINVCEEIAAIEARGSSPRVMCPANEGGQCILYEYRPMICRLHGIPYDLQMPGSPPTRGEPCTEFSAQAIAGPYIPFDRTSFYRSMSQLEQALRLETGCFSKIKRTVAEMIAFDLDGIP